jgi:hypothetical protein
MRRSGFVVSLMFLMVVLFAMVILGADMFSGTWKIGWRL